jgi:hypothetical protein
MTFLFYSIDKSHQYKLDAAKRAEAKVEKKEARVVDLRLGMFAQQEEEARHRREGDAAWEVAKVYMERAEEHWAAAKKHGEEKDRLVAELVKKMGKLVLT